MRRAPSLFLAVALAACGAAPRTPDNAAEAAPAAGGNYIATVEALPARQRDAVLFRAIRDAGQDCQEVTGARRVEGTPAAWAVVCDGRSAWVVALDAGGTATVKPARAGG